MNPTVYFADKAVIFATEASAGAGRRFVPEAEGGISRAKILKILETQNSVTVLSPDPRAALAALAAEFTPVEAAGGIVTDDRGEWLMIHRNGRWDLPKGHLEPGESLARCAEREIAEETGVAARAVRPLCETLHAYFFPRTGRWELKRTHWFLLRAAASCEPTPQAEEGIDRAAWCSPAEVEACLRTAYPTVREVAGRLRETMDAAAGEKDEKTIENADR